MLYVSTSPGFLVLSPGRAAGGAGPVLPPESAALPARGDEDAYGAILIPTLR